MPGDRAKIWVLDEGLLMEMISGWREVGTRFTHAKLPCFDGLPPGARLVRVSHDFSRRAFLCVFEHESFDEIPPGDLLPFADEPLRIARWDDSREAFVLDPEN